MNLDLTDLRLLVRTAELGSLTQAAAANHLSLAAASARIKGLETRAAQKLLVREARGVRLTQAGEAFVHHARGMLRQAEQLRADLAEYSGGVRGHVRVLANTTAVTDFLPEILPGFLSAHPGVTVDLQEKPNADIARGVRDGRADLGIVAGPLDAAGLHAIHFSTDRLVLLVPRGHPFARRKRMDFAETLDEAHVGMHPGSTIHAFLAQEAARLNRPLKLRIQLSGFDAMCRMIGAGVGVGVVPESAARRNLKGMGLVQIALTDRWAVRERHVLVRETGALPAYAQALVETLCAHYGRALNAAPGTPISP